MTGVTTVGGTTAVVAVAAEGAGTVAVIAVAPKRSLPAMAIEPATASKRATACRVELMVEQNGIKSPSKIHKEEIHGNIE